MILIKTRDCHVVVQTHVGELCVEMNGVMCVSPYEIIETTNDQIWDFLGDLIIEENIEWTGMVQSRTVIILAIVSTDAFQAGSVVMVVRVAGIETNFKI